MSKSKSIERELSPEKTEAILDGAMQEFLENGYAAARMDKIAIAAGVSKATVYRRFPDKESLFTALMQRLACQKGLFNLFNLEDLQPAEAEPAAFLRSFAAQMLSKVTADPQILTFFRIIIAESGRFPELARSFVQNIEKPTLEHLTQYLAAQTQLRLPDPEVAARAFVGALIHFIMLRDILQSGDLVPMDADRLVEHLLDLIIHRDQRQPDGDRPSR